MAVVYTTRPRCRTLRLSRVCSFGFGDFGFWVCKRERERERERDIMEYSSGVYYTKRILENSESREFAVLVLEI